MRLLKEGAPDTDERLAYREIVYANTIQSMVVVVFEILEALDLPLDPSLQKHVEAIEDVDPNDPNLADFQGNLLPALGAAIAALWASPAVRQGVARSSEFQLNDSAKYYFESVERVAARGYVPTVEDILRSRVKSTGITEATFAMAGNLSCKMFDVGGQRSERKKWIHCFDNVNLVFFVVAISEFNQVLYEDGATNRMEEAQTLFESVANSRWFANSSILLFLNKTDLLEEKLKTDRLVDFFPDYRGPNELAPVCEYWKTRFRGLYRHSFRTLICHLTCATDAKQMKVVFAAIENNILETTIAEAGML